MSTKIDFRDHCLVTEFTKAEVKDFDGKVFRIVNVNNQLIFNSTWNEFSKIKDIIEDLIVNNHKMNQDEKFNKSVGLVSNYLQYYYTPVDMDNNYLSNTLHFLNKSEIMERLKFFYNLTKSIFVSSYRKKYNTRVLENKCLFMATFINILHQMGYFNFIQPIDFQEVIEKIPTSSKTIPKIKKEKISYYYTKYVKYKNDDYVGNNYLLM